MKKLLKMGNAAWFISAIILMVFSNGCGKSGGDAASDTTPSTTYTGSTNQATITQGNAQSLAEAGTSNAEVSSVAGGASSDAPAFKGSPAFETASLAPKTLAGNCGGSSVTDSTYDTVTGKISGTTTDSSYCQNGTTKNGLITYSGTITQATSKMTLSISFTSYNVKDSASDSLMNGTILLSGSSGTVSTATMTMNTNVRNNLLNTVSKTENFTLGSTKTSVYSELSITGRLYHPEFGYVDLSTPTLMHTTAGDKHPSSGVLVITGKNNSKAKVTYISNAQYKVEVDETGSGTYTLVGTYDWKTSAASTTAPIVSKITPPFGPVGTAITIGGLNFSATAASNTVKFNGTTAVVTSATLTQIVVTVPTGATVGRLTVTTAAGTGTSGADFAVTSATNAALAGTWLVTSITTSKGVPVAFTGLTIALVVKPDNTYIAAIISNATGSYCLASGTVSSTGNTMTDTTLASTCNPADAGTTSTSTYTLSGNTLTLTDTTIGSNQLGRVDVWTKQIATPPQIVGVWGSASASALTYVTGQGAYAGNANGSSTSYEFKPDGTYKNVFLGELNFYGCKDTIFTYVLGNYSVNGSNLMLTETTNHYEYTYSCNTSKSYTEERTLESHTYPFSIEQETSQYTGTVSTKLYMWIDGESTPHSYPKK